MSRKCLLVLVLCLAPLSPARAQQASNFAWWNNPVRADLHLTDAQVQKIRQIVRSYRDRLFDARNELQKAQADLEDLMNDPKVNLAEAKPLVDRVANARANANRTLLEMHVELRSVLTLEQWRLVVKRWDEMRKGNRGDTEVTP